jgi:hypothetical protein
MLSTFKQRVQCWKADERSVYNYLKNTYWNGFGLFLAAIMLVFGSLVAFGGDHFTWWFLIPCPGSLILFLTADCLGYKRMWKLNYYNDRNLPLHIEMKRWEDQYLKGKS